MNDWPVEKKLEVEPGFKGKIIFQKEDLIVIFKVSDDISNRKDNGDSEYMVTFKFIKSDGSDYLGGLGGNRKTKNKRVRCEIKGGTLESYVVDITVKNKIGFR